MKTSDAKAPRVRISASPPFIFLQKLNIKEIRRSTQVGRRGAPAKGVGRESGARVQIPPSPPLLKYTFALAKVYLFLSLFLNHVGMNLFSFRFFIQKSIVFAL